MSSNLTNREYISITERWKCDFTEIDRCKYEIQIKLVNPNPDQSNDEISITGLYEIKFGADLGDIQSVTLRNENTTETIQGRAVGGDTIYAPKINFTIPSGEYRIFSLSFVHSSPTRPLNGLYCMRFIREISSVIPDRIIFEIFYHPRFKDVKVRNPNTPWEIKSLPERHLISAVGDLPGIELELTYKRKFEKIERYAPPIFKLIELILRIS